MNKIKNQDIQIGKEYFCRIREIKPLSDYLEGIYKVENIKEYSGDEIKISAKVSNNSKETASYFAIAGLYDEKGQLVACKNIANTLQGGKSENVNTTLSTGGRSGLTLKIIWLDMAESMKTVADTIIK